MGRKIVIEIECGKMFCEKCELQDTDYFFMHRVHHCAFFHKNLLTADEKALRCAECLAAEGGIARLEEIEKEHNQWNDANCNDCPLSAYDTCEEICQSKKTLIEEIVDLLEHRRIGNE